MAEVSPRRWYQLARYPMFSPMGFLVRAGAITAIFLIGHLAGLREYTVILSGTSPMETRLDYWRGGLGCFYMVFYFAFVLAVPVLCLAAGLMAVLLPLWGKSEQVKTADSSP